MIELRWIEKQPPYYTNSPDGGPGKPERVLQYRQWLIRLDAGGAITPTPLPVQWTDWTDVPTVCEEG